MKSKSALFICLSLTFLVVSCQQTESAPENASPRVKFVTVTPGSPASPTTIPPAPPTSKQALTLHDVATEAGLLFQHGAFKKSIEADPVAMMGGGLCWLDYDNDDWLDLYVINSYALHEVNWWQNQNGLPSNALFQNQGNGTFKDVSTESGAALTLRGNGCIAGDIDQDGDTDIYVTADGPNALLINQGNGKFIERAEAAGIAAPEWNTAAAMADFDRDGLIDLYVAGYIDLERKVPHPLDLFPQDYYGLSDHLYRNQGDGTFEDIAIQAGLVHQERGLGALFSDLDQDGDLDLYVANDGNPNRLYLNQGDGTFIDIARQAGVADRGSGMGVSAGDFNSDGWLDLVITNFDKEYNALYRNKALPENKLEFRYDTFRMGIQGFGQNQTGWGTSWLDLDLDGYLDLMTVQGKVPITNLAEDGQLIRFYSNRGDGTFRDAGRAVGSQEIGPRLARGMAAADYDNDGDLDVAIATIGGSLTLLQTNGASGNWLTVAIDRFAPGTMVFATLPDGRVLVRELHCGSSYLASEDPRLHLGLGEMNQIDKLVVILPDGTRLEYENIPANQRFEISMGSG